jgi:hypothetical protein
LDPLALETFLNQNHEGEFMRINIKSMTTFAAFMTGIFLLSPLASANMKELRAYKEAFPDAKPKCSTCHTATIPKKGAAEFNAYGQAAVAATPSAETFKKLGKAEDFKK